MIYYHKYDIKYCLGVNRSGFSRETDVENIHGFGSPGTPAGCTSFSSFGNIWKYQNIILTHFSLYSSRFSSKIEKRGLLKKKCFNLKYNFCDASKCHKKMAIAVYLMQKWLQTTLVATIVNIVPYNISSMSLLSKLFNANMASHIKENYPLKISAKDSNFISIFFWALS